MTCGRWSVQVTIRSLERSVYRVVPGWRRVPTLC